MTYETMRPKIKTGTIILFQGTGFTSNLIRWWCGLFDGKTDKYSHVGMIVRDKEHRFIFESTTLNGKKGVQLNLLSQAVRTYKGKMFVRVINGELTAKQILDLQDFISDNLDKPYETKIWELLGASTPWQVFKGNDKSFFCSELVARAFQKIGLLPKKIEAKEYKPDSFCSGCLFDRHLSADVWYGDEVQIK